MASGLAMTSANDLRTSGCISSGPIDLCIFRFLRWSRTSSSFIVGGTLPPQSLPCDPSTKEVWEKRLPVKTEAATLLTSLAFSSSIVTSFPVKSY